MENVYTNFWLLSVNKTITGDIHDQFFHKQYIEKLFHICQVYEA